MFIGFSGFGDRKIAPKRLPPGKLPPPDNCPRQTAPALITHTHTHAYAHAHTHNSLENSPSEDHPLINLKLEDYHQNIAPEMIISTLIPQKMIAPYYSLTIVGDTLNMHFLYK